MNKSITRLAKKFIKRDLKKQLNFEAVEKHLNTIGYIVLFYDECENLEIIQNYDLLDYSKRCDAFTINDGEVKIVFIRKTLSSHDMLFVILHEVGHIIMGHLECNITTANKHIQEIEADTFVYSVLNYKDNNTVLYSVLGIILTAIISTTVGYNIRANDVTHIEQQYSIPVINNVSPTVEPVETQTPIVDTTTELVYVTKTGTRYHKPDCQYVRNNNSSMPITIEEANKSYIPCKVCKP